MSDEASHQLSAFPVHLASTVAQHREALACAALQALQGTAMSAGEAEQAFASIEDFERETIYTAIDLLALWLKTSDPSSRTLLEGWISGQWGLLRLHGSLVGPDLSRALPRMKELWSEALQAHAGAEANPQLNDALNAVIANITLPTRTRLRILYVGDCLMPEIMTSLSGPGVRSQIELTQTFLHDHAPAILRKQIRALQAGDFDLVFYSPFSHTFSNQYGALMSWKATFWPRRRFAVAVEEMLADAAATVEALLRHFHCPVYVHNTAGTVQAFSLASGALKYLGALRNRATLAALIQVSLGRMIGDSSATQQLRLLDERSLLREKSTWELGRVFFHGVIFHPTMLGVRLGQKLYHEAAFAAAYLATKKVVLCDLDNTLWDGVIGEGAVNPFADRQRTLHKLRQKGVLLSINSKNDPANVHFTGSELQMQDFVAPRINWEPKTANVASISAELNLAVKDFVFIDDRPDELERVQQAFPEIVALNATDPATWEYLEHWERHLTASSGEDRTRLYQERLAREAFVGEQETASSAEQEAASLAALEIQIAIDAVDPSGLKRIVELINRTNQFNLCGSRTTVRELEVGLGSRHVVLSVSAKDRFGSMGVVGAMQICLDNNRVQIPIFVLSCRVFGFGIEYALLGAVRKVVPESDTIVGLFKETRANGPCRELYPKSNFTWTGEVWLGTQALLPPPPEWLTISYQLEKLRS